MTDIKKLLEDPNFSRELIMDHYKYPHNHGLVDDNNYLSKHSASESCIDDITVQMKVEEGIIKDIRFDGVACTISTASTSMMTDLLIDKTLDEAKDVINEYLKMVDNGEYNDLKLQEAGVFKNIYKQANRIKCATIGPDALLELILESEKNNG